MATDVRTLTDDSDVRAAAALFRTAMVGLPPLKNTVGPVTEPERTLGAHIDEQLVGATTSFTSWLAVPGGTRVPHAAVSRVGVLPTHTRRGVLTALMRAQLEQVAARGELVASLRASEGGIYERFGYGVASLSACVEISRVRARLRTSAPQSGALRMVDLEQAWQLLPRVYDKLDLRRPGVIARPEYWWNLRQSMSAEPSYAVVHGPVGAEDGFLRYHPIDTAQWFGGDERTIVVDDFVAASPVALVGLVRYLLAVDLVHKVRIPSVAPDNPLSQLFTDPRAVRTTAIDDETWLRLVDVEAALRARTYRAVEPVRIEVDDVLLPRNTGVYRIGADSVTRETAEPDLAVDVSTLAAVYLGGCTWQQLAVAGRVRERRPGAARAADEVFAVPEQPFSGTFF